MLVPATDKGDSQEDELPSSKILFASSVLAGSILAVGQAA
jgi:hypothetical protein